MINLRISLRSKLTLSYMLVVVIVVGLISTVANISIKNRFQDYVINRQEKQTDEIIELIRLKYEDDGAWDIGYLEIIGMNALQKGMVIQVTDENNQLIWSAYEHNNGLCEAMMSDMRANMYNYSGKWNGDYQEESYAITNQNKNIGFLTTGFIGPYYFNDEELGFIEALNALFIIIGICSLVLAFILGILMSLGISKPLNKIAKKAALLSVGNYKERIDDTSSTKEIGILADAINKLSDALENKESLRKQLTQDLAHELRTPLTSVQGHMEAMIDGIWSMNKERLSSCYDEIIRIKRLIGSIDDLSRLENENVILHKEEFDISKLIIGILNNYEHELLNKNIKVSYNEKVIKIFADKDKMSQVFNNLLTNAIKYSEKNDDILIDVVNHPSKIEIKMNDTGIGISESDLPHIFERFYRVDKSRSRETGGVGIGLTITKSIIEAHGGTITVNSKTSEGTEFIIMLPKSP